MLTNSADAEPVANGQFGQVTGHAVADSTDKAANRSGPRQRLRPVVARGPSSAPSARSVVARNAGQLCTTPQADTLPKIHCWASLLPTSVIDCYPCIWATAVTPFKVAQFDPGTVSATLRDAVTSAPIAGQSVSFTLNGTEFLRGNHPC